ncbi:hypothetical protein BR93DRAFT_987741 [Coniochaeta sp. PMI_546]|nr:hypothetical protein BR93DRAFT_987741 [Coniochaeta sp. PMI_546]
MDFVLSAKSIIDSAVQAVPQAALAWTGVCFALHVGNRGIPSSSSTRMDWYWNLASLLLRENTVDGASAGLRQELEKKARLLVPSAPLVPDDERVLLLPQPRCRLLAQCRAA